MVKELRILVEVCRRIVTFWYLPSVISNELEHVVGYFKIVLLFQSELEVFFISPDSLTATQTIDGLKTISGHWVKRREDFELKAILSNVSSKNVHLSYYLSFNHFW